MKYRNTKTGAIIDVKSKISGGNWEPVKVPRKPAVKKGAAKKNE